MGVEIEFFPIDIDYKIDAIGEAVIRIFGRDKSGKGVCVKDKNFRPYFYAILKKGYSAKDLKKTLKFDDIDVDFIDEKGKVKIVVKNPADIKIVRDVAKESKHIIETREYDIPFTKRYLIDKKIVPLVLCKVKGEVVKTSLDVDYVIELKNIECQEEGFNNPKVLSFDIETYNPEGRYSDARKDPVIMLGVYGNNFKKVITWKKFSTENEDIIFVEGEAELLKKFKDLIKYYRPDYLLGYNTDGFDFPYLKERCKRNGIKLNIGLDGSEARLNRNGARIKGIVHLDLFKFVSTIMRGSLLLESYSLNSVAKEFLGEEKDDLDVSKLGLAWDVEKGLEEFCEYNLQDCKLTYEIFGKIKENIHEIAKLIGQMPYDISRTSYGNLVEWYLIKKAKGMKMLIPNKPAHGQIGERRMHTYEGAFVFEPKPGVFEDICVLDFKSLYPTVLVAKNISPETLTNNPEGAYETPEIVGEEGYNVKYYFSYKEEGFLPMVIKDLIVRRNRIKEMMKKNKDSVLEARSYALKTIANSSYGYLGFFGARWYSRECASAITAFGRQYIRETIDKAKEEGFEVIYSDTDSVLMCLKGKNRKDALIFMNKINRELPSLMELELEDFYPRGVFVTKKGKDVRGAKKKYALINDEGKIKVRGFEAVRRDWSLLAREVQNKVIGIILKKGNIEEAFKFVRRIINDIRSKKIDVDKMVIQTQLKKPLGSYDLKGPHVIVAQKMKKKGYVIGVGSIIQYVVGEGKGIIRDRAVPAQEADDYDADYYVNRQIMPAVEKIFEAVGYKKEDLLASKDQSKLGAFI